VIQNKFDQLIASSELVVTNSERFMRHLEGNYSQSGKKLFNLPQSFRGDPERIRQMESGAVTIGYFGSLNRPRSLIPLLSAVRFLQNELGCIRFWRVVIAGSGDGIAEAIDYSRNYLMESSFTYLGQISISEVLEQSQLCNCLVVVQPESLKYEVPGKLFDCLKSGKPLLAIADPESETGKIAGKYPLGGVARPNEHGEIASLLKSIVSLNLNDPHLRNSVGNYVNQYSYETLKKNLSNLVRLLAGD
jgi:hypothetical protein